MTRADEWRKKTREQANEIAHGIAFAGEGSDEILRFAHEAFERGIYAARNGFDSSDIENPYESPCEGAGVCSASEHCEAHEALMKEQPEQFFLPVEEEYDPPYPIRECFVRCRNCGKEYHLSACGPSHALIAHQITLTRFNIKYEVRKAHSGWTAFFETPTVGFTGSGVYFDAEEKAVGWGREEWANRLARAVAQHEVATAERLRWELEGL